MNHLYYGDNIDVLRKHIKDESVDLCYIDPPFNSKRNYNQIYNNVGKEDKAQAQAFIDTWEWNERAEDGFNQILDNYQGKFTSQIIDLIAGLSNVLGKGSLLAYLISITLRVVEIHRVLKPTGSFYLHCDPTASHYLKIILDAVFCSQGGDFINEVVWKRTNAKSLAFTRFAVNHDVILRYSKSSKWTWNPQYNEHNPEYVEKFYRYVEPVTGRRYRLSDLTNPNKNRPNLTYEFLGVMRVWRWTKERMQEAYEQGLVIQNSPGAVPCLKRYLDEQNGNPIDDVWTDILPLSAQAKERLGYPTQKPESLLERIIKASSNEGDVVLDAYCGCGTTVAVAQRLNRQWIGIDITYQSISLILKRLEDAYSKAVLEQVKLSGLPKDIKSAEALATRNDDRTRKEFEKWAVLTYSNNRAVINQKKGADRGIDGFAYFLEAGEGHKKVVLQVKSGNVSSRDIRDLHGTMHRESAAMGIFITLKNPTSEMIKEAKTCGVYQHKAMGRSYPCIQIVTIKEILEQNKRLEIPLSLEVLKSAEKQSVKGEQLNLELDNMESA